MTTRIATTGAYAERALAAFTRLSGADDDGSGIVDPAVREAASEFVSASLGLMDRFPESARKDFAAVLPFSKLELRLLRDFGSDDRRVTDAVTERLLEWVNRSPVFVDEVSVHAAEFLTRLTPHLDLWSERESANAAIGRLLHV